MLVLGHQWPEPDATAAGERILWLLKGFLDHGYRITFASAAGPGAYEADLESLGIEKVPIQLNDSRFDQFLDSRQFTLVLFDRFLTEEQFSWRVRDALPKAILLLDTEDLHSLRSSRADAVRHGRKWNRGDWVQHPLFYREIASMFRSDLSLIISNREMELLTAQVPLLKAQLLYLPFGMQSSSDEEVFKYEKRSGFIFVGNGKHRPNLDAITQLKKEIWPRIRALLPGVQLRIYGAYLPESVFQYHVPEEGFEVKGWASDLSAVFRDARLQLAPLRYGAGIKGKILKAARSGLPTMGTGVAFEGILMSSKAAGFTADNPDAFAQKAVKLYLEESQWNRTLLLQQEAAEVHLDTSFESLMGSLESLEDRTMDFSDETRMLRNLLRNEAFGRVRYLSRWIEAKEKGEN